MFRRAAQGSTKLIAGADPICMASCRHFSSSSSPAWVAPALAGDQVHHDRPVEGGRLGKGYFHTLGVMSCPSMGPT